MSPAMDMSFVLNEFIRARGVALWKSLCLACVSPWIQYLVLSQKKFKTKQNNNNKSINLKNSPLQFLIQDLLLNIIYLITSSLGDSVNFRTW